MTIEGHPEPSPFNIGEDEITLLQQLVQGQRETNDLLNKVIAATGDVWNQLDTVSETVDEFLTDWQAANTAPAIPTQVQLDPGIPVENQKETP